MKKLALLLVVAIVIPSLILAWLAVRSLRDQQLVLERQQSLVFQGVADAVAKEVATAIAARQREFAQHVEQLLSAAEPRPLAVEFDQRLRGTWPLAEVGFAVGLEGSMHSPSLFARPEARRFRLENERFLTSRETVEVYWDSPKGPINLTKLDRVEAAPNKSDMKLGDKSVFATKAGTIPTREPGPSAESNLVGSAMQSKAEFRQLIGDSTDGTIARFVQDNLHLLLWYRSPRDPSLIFGAQISLPRLIESIRPLVRNDSAVAEDIAIALLDDAGRGVIKVPATFDTSGANPFVASDIGKALPHWQIGVFLVRPEEMGRSAQTLKLFLGGLVGLLLLAIGAGAWVIAIDLKRQLTLARQKTDFVSNVSHELKTPLTSIRMFSELLAEGRVIDPDKQRHYLQIITAETARLTRLINNVLDFSRLERGEKKYHFQGCDLVELVGQAVATYRPHLEEAGFRVDCSLPGEPLFVRGDRDALAQVLVNLLSNAEKYSSDCKQITIEMETAMTPLPFAEIRVLDRGAGVPSGCEEKIFEQFYRAHDSLNSGIQGSGLGLTLARQIVRAHGGELSYERRAEGGSKFIIRLTLQRTPEPGLRNVALGPPPAHP